MNSDVEKIYQKVSKRLGEASVSAFSEEVIKDLIEDSLLEVYEFLNYSKDNELPDSCLSVAKDLTIIKFNRLGSEGLSSSGYGGNNENYLNDIPLDLKRKLRRYRKLPK